jgi:hypothetical protein
MLNVPSKGRRDVERSESVERPKACSRSHSAREARAYLVSAMSETLCQTLKSQFK